MGLYGRARYGRGYYGRSYPPISTYVPVRCVVYDRNGGMKGLFQSGSCALVSVEFSHSERGCSAFAMEFAEAVDLEKTDRVFVKLSDSDRNFFYGVVRGVPILGSTSRQYVYSGYGLNDYFLRCNGEAKAYATKTLTYIVEDLLDTVLVIKSPILKDMARVNLPSITVTSWIITFEQMDTILDTLKQIAESTGDEYMYGVDADGYFFFRPRSVVVLATLVVGKIGRFGIQAYEPEDEQESVTKLFVLDKDGVYKSTMTSASGEDIKEEKYRGSDVDDSDLTLMAQGYLSRAEQVTRSAPVEWPVERTSPAVVFADGCVRVVSSVPPDSGVAVGVHTWGDGLWGDGLWGGEEYTGYDLDDTLAVREAAYRIDAAGATRTLQLGALPKRIETDIVRESKRLTALEVSLGV
jgi:hypothetical protein